MRGFYVFMWLLIQLSGYVIFRYRCFEKIVKYFVIWIRYKIIKDYIFLGSVIKYFVFYQNYVVNNECFVYYILYV